ncbi:MAG: galactose mutarotase [Proteobacteria bacterium]|nr:galactose mutarotase [Pseudomonadota bacterium]
MELPSCSIHDQTVRCFRLTNRQAMSVELMEYGATIVKVAIPDKSGELVQINLGLPDPQSYATNPAHFGGTCGRYANRISQGRFELDGRPYQLNLNDGAHHLHGGITGFDSRHWRATPMSGEEYVGVRMEYTSPDGEEGYPGTLRCLVEFTLNQASVLTIHYQARVEGVPTVVNLTNHSYWNLAGSGSILGHLLEIPGRSILEVNQDTIPTGLIRSVTDTAFDFASPRQIASHPNDLPLAVNDVTKRGFDHCYLVERSVDPEQSDLILAARLTDPVSRRVMDVMTDQPGVQFYTGTYLDGTESVGHFDQYAGLCLECQQFPDAPNHPTFPDVVLKPGETYRQTSSYGFRWPQG